MQEVDRYLGATAAAAAVTAGGDEVEGRIDVGQRVPRGRGQLFGDFVSGLRSGVGGYSGAIDLGFDAPLELFADNPRIVLAQRLRLFVCNSCGRANCPISPLPSLRRPGWGSRLEQVRLLVFADEDVFHPGDQRQPSPSRQSSTERSRSHTLGSEVTFMRSSTWVGWAALVVGIGAMVASITVSSTRVGEGLTFGFGAFIAFFGVLSLPVRNRTPDHWGLFVVGLAMFLLPWLGAGFVPDRGAAWTAWIAGFLAMALGATAWARDNPPTASGMRDYSAGGAERSAFSCWISRAALVVGVVTVVLAGTVVRSSPVPTAVLIGLGGLTAVTALWSLLAGDPTRDFLALAVVGFALFLAPWVGGFAGGSAAWTAWISGCIVTVLGVAGYLRGESLDVSETVADAAEIRYRERFRRPS